PQRRGEHHRRDTVLMRGERVALREPLGRKDERKSNGKSARRRMPRDSRKPFLRQRRRRDMHEELGNLAPHALRHHPHLLVELALTRSEEHTSELQSRGHLVCRLLLEKKTGARRVGSESC